MDLLEKNSWILEKVYRQDAGWTYHKDSWNIYGSGASMDPCLYH